MSDAANIVLKVRICCARKFAILTRALVMMKFKGTEGATEGQFVKCNCVHLFRHECLEQYYTIIQIPSRDTRWLIRLRNCATSRKVAYSIPD